MAAWVRGEQGSSQPDFPRSFMGTFPIFQVPIYQVELIIFPIFQVEWTNFPNFQIVSNDFLIFCPKKTEEPLISQNFPSLKKGTSGQPLFTFPIFQDFVIQSFKLGQQVKPIFTQGPVTGPTYTLAPALSGTPLTTGPTPSESCRHKHGQTRTRSENWRTY